MTIRDADGSVWKEVQNPAVVYDITTGQLLFVGEFEAMEKLYDTKRSELLSQGKIQAANDMHVERIKSQEQLDKIWQSGKVEVRH